MRPSKSKYIKAESISLLELTEQPSGAYGLYELAEVDGMTTSAVRAKVSSNATATFAKKGKNCDVRSVLITMDFDADKTPTTTKQLMIICR